MFYKIIYIVLTALMLKRVMGIDISDVTELSPDYDERLLILPAIQFNATNLFANNLLVPILFGAVAVSVLSVAFSIGLGIILFSFLFKNKYNDNKHYGGTGYSTGYGTGTSEGHTSYRSFFDPSLIDWENFSVVDMLYLGSETWSKYEPSNKNCMKRFICEVHRDTKLLGFTAEKIVVLFSSYLSLSNSAPIPLGVREELNNFQKAADVGRYLKRDCGEFYHECKFSLSKMIKELKTRHSDDNQIENET